MEYSVSDCISAEVIKRQPADNHCTEEGNGRKTYWKPARQGQKVLKLNLHCCICKKNELSNSYVVWLHCLSLQCETNTAATGIYKKLLKTEACHRWIAVCTYLWPAVISFMSQSTLYSVNGRPALAANISGLFCLRNHHLYISGSGLNFHQ